MLEKKRVGFFLPTQGAEKKSPAKRGLFFLQRWKFGAKKKVFLFCPDIVTSPKVMLESDVRKERERTILLGFSFLGRINKGLLQICFRLCLGKKDLLKFLLNF